jgi:hypothetical protein
MTLKFLFALTTLVLGIAGCKKTVSVDNDTDSSRDNAFVETSYDDAENIAQEAGSAGSVSTYRNVRPTNLLSTCAILTFQNKNKTDPDTITIDFGTGCFGFDGRLRTGQVIVYYTSPYKVPGHSHTITFNKYTVDGNQLEGSETVTNNGLNISGLMNWSLDVNGSIALSGGGTASWSAARTSVLLSGWNSADSTIAWSAAKWSLTGGETGFSARGISYTASAGSPLIRDFTCIAAGRRYYTQGILSLQPVGEVVRTVNYGNGTCGSPLTVMISGTTYDLVLR